LSEEAAVTPGDPEARRLWALVEAGIFLTGELHLEAVLDRIVQTACHVIGTRYGAIGVLNEEGTGLSNFVFHGLSEFDRMRIGNLPIGRGLLGVLINDPRPIRLDDISNDPRSVGFPEHHPPMHSFLGVPVLSRGRVFGNLYLTEKERGAKFTEEDEKLAIVLAGQAGVAVDNARLYEAAQASEVEVRRQLREIEAVDEIRAALLAEMDPARVLRMIASSARDLAGASVVTVAMFDEDGKFKVRAAVGQHAGRLEGLEYELEGTASERAMQTGQVQLVDDAITQPSSPAQMEQVRDAAVRSIIIAPLTDRSGAVGVLGVSHNEPSHFGSEDIHIVKRIAELGSLALRNAQYIATERERISVEAELAESKVREQLRTETLRAVIRAQEEERRRIARELHDTAGQALASILLGLKVVREERTLEEARARLADLREVTAAAASEVRRIALELRPTALDDLGLQVAIERYARDVSDRTGINISTAIDLDERLEPDVETIVYRVTQESMTNAVKYAEASHISISILEGDGGVRLLVSDDGKGFDLRGAEGKGLGLLGMNERAELIGGRLHIHSVPGQGTTVELQIKRGSLGV
jgi:signal transduction histidine kinase